MTGPQLEQPMRRSALTLTSVLLHPTAWKLEARVCLSPVGGDGAGGVLFIRMQAGDVAHKTLSTRQRSNPGVAEMQNGGSGQWEQMVENCQAWKRPKEADIHFP